MKKLLLLLPLLTLTSCSNEIKNTSLGWCLWEIKYNLRYDVLFYTYEEAKSFDYKIEEPKYKYDCLVIQTYNDESKTEWFCFVVYTSKGLNKTIKSSNIVEIDCDIIHESNIY